MFFQSLSNSTWTRNQNCHQLSAKEAHSNFVTHYPRRDARLKNKTYLCDWSETEERFILEWAQARHFNCRFFWHLFFCFKISLKAVSGSANPRQICSDLINLCTLLQNSWKRTSSHTKISIRLRFSRGASRNPALLFDPMFEQTNRQHSFVAWHCHKSSKYFSKKNRKHVNLETKFGNHNKTVFQHMCRN